MQKFYFRSHWLLVERFAIFLWKQFWNMKTVQLVKYLIIFGFSSNCEAFLDLPHSHDGILSKISIKFKCVYFDWFFYSWKPGDFFGIFNPPAKQKNTKIYPGNECYRDCDGSRPQICFFEWTFELYQVLGGFGFLLFVMKNEFFITNHFFSGLVVIVLLEISVSASIHNVLLLMVLKEVSWA